MASPYVYTNAGRTGAFDTQGTIAGGETDMLVALSAANARIATLASTVTNANSEYIVDAYGALRKSEEITADLLTQLQFASVQLIVETVDDAENIPKKDPGDAVEKLISFMKEDNEVFKEYAVASTEAVDTSATGDGVLIVGLNHPDMDRQLQNIRAEVVTFECVKDAQGPDIVVPGEEVFEAKGEQAYPRTSRLFPGGSGMKTFLTSAHGGQDQYTRPGANILLNSDFEDWTSNVPDSWTLKTGTAGVDLNKESSTILRGSAAGSITGDGATLVHLRLPLDGVSGMKLRPQRPYVISMWMRRDSSAPAAGVLKIAFTQSDTTTIIDDENATDIAVTVDLTSDLTTSYQNFSGVFWTPKSLPTNPDISIMLTTALTSSRVVFFDDLVVAEAVVPHAAGPQFLIHAGATDWVYGDKLTATITNAATEDTWVRKLDRALGLYDLSIDRARAMPLAKAILFPTTSGTATIPDSLITTAVS